MNWLHHSAAISLALYLSHHLGGVHLQVLPDLLADAAGTSYDAVLAVGDFAYDLRDDDGHRGDEYMSMIQPLAATMPFMTCPGNHEVHYNFSHYRCCLLFPFHLNLASGSIRPIDVLDSLSQTAHSGAVLCVCVISPELNL